MFDRVLIVAPHPDDESVATAGLIQRARRVRVVIATDGERNGFPQRAMLRKLRITEKDRIEWGDMRRRETLAALATLGIDDAAFLGFPDQRLLALARRHDAAVRDALAEEIRRFAPTLIVSPSALDLHADHRALAWFVHAVAGQIPIVTALVHGVAPPSRVAFTISLTGEERRRKLEAIQRHASQLLLSRKRFVGFARETETYLIAEHDLVAVESRAAELRKSLRRALRVVSSLFR